MFNLDPQQFSAVLVVLFYALANGTVYLYHVIVHRLPASQQARLQEFVQVGVKAAEQVATTGPIAKKQYALTAIEDLCKQFHVTFDPVIVGHFIEAAVHELKTLVPASAPIADSVSQGVSWLNDAPVTTSTTPSNTSFPQGFLPIIPQSMPGSSQ